MSEANASAPVALEICQSYCALHDAMSAGEAHHGHGGHHATALSGHENAHHCHDMVMPKTVPAASQAMTGLPHSCAHSDDLPPSAGTALLVTVAPAAGVVDLLPRPALQAFVRGRPPAGAGSLASRIVLAAQLRV
jgi:hypothetical protein